MSETVTVTLTKAQAERALKALEIGRFDAYHRAEAEEYDEVLEVEKIIWCAAYPGETFEDEA